MKNYSKIVIVTLFCLAICFCSFKRISFLDKPSDYKLFVKKTTNSWQEADIYGNSTSLAYFSDNIFTVYVNWQTNKGYSIVKNVQTGEQYRIDGTIYSNVAKGLRVYYLQENSGKCKMSFSKEENGTAIYTYASKTLTVFFNR
jgi:hypothetical protein